MMIRDFNMIGIIATSMVALFGVSSCKLAPDDLKPSDSPVYVSEYMTRNTTFMTVNGKTPGWVEIFNPSENDIDLSGYRLCVNGKQSAKLRNVVLPAGERVVVLLSKMDINEGDEFFLVDKSSQLVDLLTAEHLKKNSSIWRSKDAEGQFVTAISESPTPQFSDDAEGIDAYHKSLIKENTTGVMINEVLASNSTAYQNANGAFVDYVELINTAKDSVDISGFGISDDIDHLYKIRFEKGTKLGPGEIRLVELNDFSINNGSEGVFLSDDMTYVIDAIPVLKTSRDQCLYRMSNGNWAKSWNITPGQPNTPAGAKAYLDSRKAEPFRESKVIISEAMSRNTLYSPVKGNYYDWIELYNCSSDTVNLKDWKLTDGKHEYTFGEKTIGAGKYAIVYASDKKLSDVTNTGFNLNGNCEAYLFNENGELVDCIGLTELPCNVSKGRAKNGNAWVYFSKPTPGAENGSGYRYIADTPKPELPSGQYDAPDGLVLKLEGEGTIYYTTDGSLPTSSSAKYKDSIRIKNTTVIRAYSVVEGAINSPVATYNYILNQGHKLDVICLSSDPDGLYSYSSGIFSMGPGASAESPHFGANYWKGWKRKTNVEFLPHEGDGFNVDCALSIFGGFTKANPKKSTKMKFKDIYGTPKVKCANLFKTRDIDEFESLVLRAGGQDTYAAMLRDDVISYLADTLMQHNTMASHPVVLYINGAYNGVFYLREKINADFIASHYDIPKDHIDLIQGNRSCQAGSVGGWLSLLNYVKTHNLADSTCYKYVTDRVDVANYADYVITEMYTENSDLGNIRFFRSPDIDGKWRWILYDTDMSFRAKANTKGGAFAVMNPAGCGAGLMFQTNLINGLLKNKDFRELFISRMEYQMKNVWNEERVLAGIDYFAGMIESEVPQDRKRWNTSTNWKNQVELMREFARTRQARLRKEFETAENTRRIIKLNKEELDRIFGEN